LLTRQIDHLAERMRFKEQARNRSFHGILPGYGYLVDPRWACQIAFKGLA
jgi:hypothetical protein